MSVKSGWRGLSYHRFWAEADIATAFGTFAHLDLGEGCTAGLPWEPWALTSQGRAQWTMMRNAAVRRGAVAGLGWQERGLSHAAARGELRRPS